MADLVTLGIEVEARGGARARRELDGVKTSAAGAARSVDTLEDQTRALDRAQMSAARSSGRLAVQHRNATRAQNARTASLQNVSFQLQDIITQIQLGTHPIRALSVQLPQLLGGFGAIGAAAGVAAGLIGGLAISMFDFGESASDAEKDGETFEERLRSISARLDDVTTKANLAAGAIQLFDAATIGGRRAEITANLQSQLAGRRASTITPEAQALLDAFGVGNLARGAGTGLTAREGREQARAERGRGDEITLQIIQDATAQLGGLANESDNLRIAAERLRLEEEEAERVRNSSTQTVRRSSAEVSRAAGTFQQMDRAAERFYREQDRRDRERERAERERQRELAREAAQFEREFVDPVTSGMESVLVGARSFGDAMERVALDLSSALIRRNVSEPLTAGISGILGGLDFGSLFSFDGGGFTGSGARSGGLDGRGGFLAMMHPNETVIDHTRGGGGGGAQVVVNVRSEMGGQVQATQNGRMVDIVLKAVAADVQQGGNIGRAISRTFKIGPQLQRRA